MDLYISILEQGFIFGIMVLGVYITYKILDFPDLTVEGSFPLGAAVTASFIVKGINPYAACFFSFLAGSAAGLATGVLHVKLKMTNLLAGILVMIGLYSINLRIMGKANIPLFNKTNIFTGMVPVAVIAALFAICIKILLDLFLKTKFGFLLIATGDNPELVTSLGINTGFTKIVGLMLSNALVSLSGSLMAQYQNFADVGMGTGIIVMGLASVIIGEAILKKVSIILPTTMALIGSVLYRACIAFALKLNFPATDLKLITSLIVIVALALNRYKIGERFKKLFTARGGIDAAH
ncbi:MAG: ABC transporter permease [Clostridiales bacterium]|nr:ABC transporter permease [Clostridiales bacterium]HBM80079.1 ABC transporter permease [Clostridiaceae bacterium]